MIDTAIGRCKLIHAVTREAGAANYAHAKLCTKYPHALTWCQRGTATVSCMLMLARHFMNIMVCIACCGQFHTTSTPCALIADWALQTAFATNVGRRSTWPQARPTRPCSSFWNAIKQSLPKEAISLWLPVLRAQGSVCGDDDIILSERFRIHGTSNTVMQCHLQLSCLSNLHWSETNEKTMPLGNTSSVALRWKKKQKKQEEFMSFHQPTRPITCADHDNHHSIFLNLNNLRSHP